MDNKEQNMTCESCKNLCPFIDGHSGNCYLDMKEVDIKNDFCFNYEYESGVVKLSNVN